MSRISTKVACLVIALIASAVLVDCTKSSDTPAAVRPDGIVEIVSAACTEPAPGATAGGLNVQLAPGGRLEQPSVTLFVNAPPCAATVTWYAADCPAPTVADPGVAATPKFVTVI